MAGTLIKGFQIKTGTLVQSHIAAGQVVKGIQPSGGIAVSRDANDVVTLGLQPHDLSGAFHTGTLSVPYGGTGATSVAGARANLGAADDSRVVHNVGDEVITGWKTFGSPPLVNLGSRSYGSPLFVASVRSDSGFIKVSTGVASQVAGLLCLISDETDGTLCDLQIISASNTMGVVSNYVSYLKTKVLRVGVENGKLAFVFTTVAGHTYTVSFWGSVLLGENVGWGLTDSDFVSATGVVVSTLVPVNAGQLGSINADQYALKSGTLQVTGGRLTGSLTVAATSLEQIVFDSPTGGYRHTITTQHDSGDPEKNEIAFNVWTPGQGMGDLPATKAMSISQDMVTIPGCLYLSSSDFPLMVDSRAVVANLNAEMVGGRTINDLPSFENGAIPVSQGGTGSVNKEGAVANLGAVGLAVKQTITADKTWSGVQVDSIGIGWSRNFCNDRMFPVQIGNSIVTAYHPTVDFTISPVRIVGADPDTGELLDILLTATWKVSGGWSAVKAVSRGSVAPPLRLAFTNQVLNIGVNTPLDIQFYCDGYVPVQDDNRWFVQPGYPTSGYDVPYASIMSSVNGNVVDLSTDQVINGKKKFSDLEFQKISVSDSIAPVAGDLFPLLAGDLNDLVRHRDVDSLEFFSAGNWVAWSVDSWKNALYDGPNRFNIDSGHLLVRLTWSVVGSADYLVMVSDGGMKLMGVQVQENVSGSWVDVGNKSWDGATKFESCYVPLAQQGQFTQIRVALSFAEAVSLKKIAILTSSAVSVDSYEDYSGNFVVSKKLVSLTEDVPFQVASSQQVANLNASLLCGKAASDFVPASGVVSFGSERRSTVLAAASTTQNLSSLTFVMPFVLSSNWVVQLLLQGVCGLGLIDTVLTCEWTGTNWGNCSMVSRGSMVVDASLATKDGGMLLGLSNLPQNTVCQISVLSSSSSYSLNGWSAAEGTLPIGYANLYKVINKQGAVATIVDDFGSVGMYDDACMKIKRVAGSDDILGVSLKKADGTPVMALLQTNQSNLHIVGESVVGNIDGVNVVYQVQNTYRAGSLAVYLNGVRISRGQYSEQTGSTFSLVDPPSIGDLVEVDYDLA
jgi:hypothetical protein